MIDYYASIVINLIITIYYYLYWIVLSAGVLHSGLGWTHLKKFLACINIPCPDFKTFKKYEQEVGLAAEEVVKESCIEATALERKLTIEKAESIEK